MKTHEEARGLGDRPAAGPTFFASETGGRIHSTEIAMIRILLAMLFLFAASGAFAGEVGIGRLPDTATPLHYALDLRIDPDQPRFSGEVRIRVHLKEAMRRLRLHARDLDIAQVVIVDAKGRRRTGRVHADEALIAAGQIEIDFGRRLPAQQVELRIRYDAPFDQRLHGLYRMQAAGRWYVASQLAVLSARQVFPGFDEPRFKTPFAVAIAVPEDHRAFANGAETRVVGLDESWRRFEFAATPPLPTYLVAIAAGPWEVREGPPVPPASGRESVLPVRALSVIGESARTEEALAETPQLVAAMEAYFDAPYAYGKLDLLAAPEYSYGAMENPGLIVYRDHLLLRDAGTSTSARRDSYNIHAHELAHQWVGNLVTLAWWDDVWLNEAFATWMASRVSERLRPDWNIDLARFEDTRDAFVADSLVSARRIRQPIHAESDIQGAFDTITYIKGAAILHMLEAWLGSDTFREGIRRFVAAHRHGTATSTDLIAAVAAVDPDKPFSPAIDSFLNQPGIPLLRTRLQCEAGGAELHWSQQRYLPLGASVESSQQQWTLPLCLRLGHAGESFVHCEAIREPAGRLRLERGCPDWYFPNADARGYYRFAQSSADRADLIAAWDRLSEVERLAHADAIAAGFNSGDVDAVAVLDAVPRLAAAESPQLVMALIDTFQWIREHLADGQTRPALDAFANRLYGPRLRTLGYQARPGEAEQDSLLRGRLARLLALTTFDADARAALLEQGDRVLVAQADGSLDFSAADANLLAPILRVLVQERGQAATDALLAELQRAPSPTRRSAMLQALGGSLDPDLAGRMRDRMFADDIVITDTMAVLFGGFSHADTRSSVQDWIARNFDAFVRRLPDMRQGNVPELLAAGQCSEEQAARLQAFIEPRLSALSGGEQGLRRALERIAQCQALRTAQSGPALGRWLAERAVGR